MDNELKLPRDLVIPTKLAFSKEIESEYKFLFMYISYRASTRGYIWYGNETLADHICKNERSIKRGLRALADAKWIKIDNRVKKSSLYHQDMRRVIWIYSDYLVALDKGGYGVSRPLAFTTFRKRFIAALIDETKIPLLMYFFPVAQKLGEMGVHYDTNKKELFSYHLKDKKYFTRSINSTEAREVYEKLYTFYCSRHEKDTEQKQIPTQHIHDFNIFQSKIREEYIDKDIAYFQENRITVNALGMLMQQQNNDLVQLDTNTALTVWQWLFSNQDLIIKIKDNT